MTVTGTGSHPTGHASLSDGSTTIEFLFTDGQGEKNQESFKAEPYPRTALKTTSGESKYSDLEPPYFAIAQDDWTGGRGSEDFESDTSRYFDGHWVDTSKESGVILGGRETYSTGFRNMDQAIPGSVTFQASYDTTRYLAVSFTSTVSYSVGVCEIWVKRVGTPGDLQVELWSNSGGNPNAMLESETVAVGNVTTDTISLFKNFDWINLTALDGSSDYWVVIDGGSGTDATDHWAIGVDANTAGKRSSNASSWTATTYSPYYRITPDYANFVGKFFEYKSALYMVTQPDAGGNSALYINGDRGAADSNSGNKSNLEDATKSWTTNEWANSIVLITKGPGSEEEQPWRLISSNDSNSLVCSAAWNVTHTTATEYVILGSDKWTQIDSDLGFFITDVEVSEEHIWLATGGRDADNGMMRIRYYNSSGTWTEEQESTANFQIADKLLAINHTDSGATMYCSTTDHNPDGVMIYKGKVPRDAISSADYLFHPVQEFNTSKAWNDVDVSNVTQGILEGQTRISIAAGHTTGIAAVMNIDPLDFTTGDALVAEVYSDNEALDASDYAFVIDDVEDMGQTRSPVKVFKEDYAYSRIPTKVFLEADFDGTPAFTDLTETYDGDGATKDSVSFTTDDYLWIGYSTPFNKITFDVGTTVNAVVCDTPTYRYLAGSTISSGNLSGVTDGTMTGTTPNRVPLAQDGVIAFSQPRNWQTQTVNGTEAYWVQICYNDADLTASVDLKSIFITVDNANYMTPLYDDLSNTYDGDTGTREQLTLGTEDYIYVGHGTKFNKITVDLETVSTEDGTMTATYWNGSAWTSVTITDGTKNPTYTLEQDGDITFTIPEDWEANTVNSIETYWIRLDVSTALTTAISINKITVTRQNNDTLPVPAVAEDTWTTIMTPMLPYSTWRPDYGSIKSIGLSVTVDSGANIFLIRKLWLAKQQIELNDDSAFRMPGNEYINGLQAYAGNVDDPILNPWIFTTEAVYEMQTQNNDQLVKIPLEELGSLSSPENGLGHCVNGTYLYFNIGEKIERYFNRTLDDVGPDRDEGLPNDRPGIPKSLVSYPGRVYAAIDAGSGGTSSVLALDGTAWHEVYRAPQSGLRIKNIYAQAIPNTNVDRLWISMGSDVVWVPISLNPYTESDFTFTHEGHLITSYIYANLQDVVKLWKSLKIFVENVTATRNIIADYQVDGDTTWTEIGTFDTVPVEEIDIASTLPQAKRIRYRLRFFTDDQTETPRLKAIVTEGVAFVPVKYQYAWTFKVTQDTDNINLDGEYVDTLTTLQQYNQLVSWANAGPFIVVR
jgi:hypothetical protein